MKRQGEVERLGLGFSIAQFQMMWEMSDQGRLPAKIDAERASQRQRLITYAPLLGPTGDRGQ